MEWYLLNQVHPPVSRLCHPIDGMGDVEVANCLGLDTSKFTSHADTTDNLNDYRSSSVKDSERFLTCSPFTVVCAKCGTDTKFDELLDAAEKNQVTGNISQTCFKCPSCLSVIQPASMLNQLKQSIRNHVDLFSQGWLVCEDMSCAHRTRQVALGADGLGLKCQVQGCGANIRPEYKEADLHLQLMYYERLMDYNHRKKEIAAENENRKRHQVPLHPWRSIPRVDVDTMEGLHNEAKQWLDKNACSWLSNPWGWGMPLAVTSGGSKGAHMNVD